MKILYTRLLQVLLLVVLFTSCGLDNYDEPESLLTGKVVYKGEAVQVRGTDERVRLQLFQDGYPNYTPIDVFVGQDGSFSAMLFNGDYKMVTRDNNGPWVNSRDTIHFSVKGNTVQNMEVTPYFMISNPDMKLADKKVTATFTIDQIVDGREIEYAAIVLNRTQFVDVDIRLQRQDFSGNDVKVGTVSYTIDLNNEASKSATLYGRICVKTRNTDEGIYSAPFRLK